MFSLPPVLHRMPHVLDLLIHLMFTIGSSLSCFPAFFSSGPSHPPPPPPYYVIHPGFQPRLPYIIECQHMYRASPDVQQFSEPYDVHVPGAEGAKTIKVAEAMPERK